MEASRQSKRIKQRLLNAGKFVKSGRKSTLMALRFWMPSRPEEVAPVICFLLSDAASYITVIYQVKLMASQKTCHAAKREDENHDATIK